MTLPQKCPVCGKTGKRPCPALGGLICPACCGSHRGSKINCPKECSFFPFGTAAFESWLRLNDEWIRKAVDYVRKHLPKAELEKIWGGAMPDLDKLEPKRLAALGDALITVLTTQRDAEGRTLAERWEAENWQSLSNDERVMMRYRRQLFITVVEIQRILDHQTMECLDLFDPGSRPFLVLDRRAAERPARFTRLLSATTHYPHFSRIDGVGHAIPSVIWPNWKEEVEAMVRQASAERPGLTVKEYLREHLSAAVQLIAEISEDYSRQVRSTMKTHHCVAAYELAGLPEALESILKSKPEFKLEELKAEEGRESPLALFSWHSRGGSESAELAKDSPQSEPSDPQTGQEEPAGSVSLYPNRLIVETFSEETHASAKKMVEQYFADFVRFQKEEVTDLFQRAQEKRAAADALKEATAYWESRRQQAADRAANDTESGPVPGESEPGLDRLPSEIEEKLLQEDQDERYAAFLDKANPGLDGWNPRAATQDPAMRSRLIELVKNDLHNLDRQNREYGLHLHLNRALDELGLHELK